MRIYTETHKSEIKSAYKKSHERRERNRLLALKLLICREYKIESVSEICELSVSYIENSESAPRPRSTKYTGKTEQEAYKKICDKIKEELAKHGNLLVLFQDEINNLKIAIRIYVRVSNKIKTTILG